MIKPLQKQPIREAGALTLLPQLSEKLTAARKCLKAVQRQPAPGDSGMGHSYRVCFMNRFARGRNTITACQRSIVIPAAGSREAAIEAAKRQFAELEGIRDWNLHAMFIEAGLLEDGDSAGCESQQQCPAEHGGREEGRGS
jgi:hypothetical protein